jgi:hypothetical protein
MASIGVTGWSEWLWEFTIVAATGSVTFKNKYFDQ